MSKNLRPNLSRAKKILALITRLLLTLTLVMSMPSKQAFANKAGGTKITNRISQAFKRLIKKFSYEPPKQELIVETSQRKQQDELATEKLKNVIDKVFILETAGEVAKTGEAIGKLKLPKLDISKYKKAQELVRNRMARLKKDYEHFMEPFSKRKKRIEQEKKAKEVKSEQYKKMENDIIQRENALSDEEFLAKYTVNIKEQAKKMLSDMKDLTCKETEVIDILAILSKSKISNAVILADPGVGKTAISKCLVLAVYLASQFSEAATRLVRGSTESNKILADASQWLTGRSQHSQGLLAEAMFARHANPKLSKWAEFEMPLIAKQQLIAGTEYRGAVERRMERLKEISLKRKVILHGDEGHELLSLLEGYKPELAESNNFNLIVYSTKHEWMRAIAKDPALMDRFTVYYKQQPTTFDAFDILRGIADYQEAKHKITITDDALREIIKLAPEINPAMSRPRNAVDYLDTVISQFFLDLGVQTVKADKYMTQVNVGLAQLVVLLEATINKQSQLTAMTEGYTKALKEIELLIVTIEGYGGGSLGMINAKKAEKALQNLSAKPGDMNFIKITKTEAGEEVYSFTNLKGLITASGKQQKNKTDSEVIKLIEGVERNLNHFISLMARQEREEMAQAFIRDLQAEQKTLSLVIKEIETELDNARRMNERDLSPSTGENEHTRKFLIAGQKLYQAKILPLEIQIETGRQLLNENINLLQRMFEMRNVNLKARGITPKVNVKGVHKNFAKKRGSAHPERLALEPGELNNAIFTEFRSLLPKGEILNSKHFVAAMRKTWSEVQNSERPFCQILSSRVNSQSSLIPKIFSEALYGKPKGHDPVLKIDLAEPGNTLERLFGQGSAMDMGGEAKQYAGVVIEAIIEGKGVVLHFVNFEKAADSRVVEAIAQILESGSKVAYAGGVRRTVSFKSVSIFIELNVESMLKVYKGSLQEQKMKHAEIFEQIENIIKETMHNPSIQEATSSLISFYKEVSNIASESTAFIKKESMSQLLNFLGTNSKLINRIQVKNSINSYREVIKGKMLEHLDGLNLAYGFKHNFTLSFDAKLISTMKKYAEARQAQLVKELEELSALSKAEVDNVLSLRGRLKKIVKSENKVNTEAEVEAAAKEQKAIVDEAVEVIDNSFLDATEKMIDKNFLMEAISNLVSRIDRAIADPSAFELSNGRVDKLKKIFETENTTTIHIELKPVKNKEFIPKVESDPSKIEMGWEFELTLKDSTGERLL